MVPDYSFHGTDGMYTSSKSHLRESAIIPACRHIGTGLLVIHLSLFQVCDPDGQIDSPDFYESSFWNDSDPNSGLGGWGDPNADYQVPDGGLHTLQLAYPLPHFIRRNFSIYSPPFPGTEPANPVFNDPILFSASEVETVLNVPPGDYLQFQIEIGVRT